MEREEETRVLSKVSDILRRNIITRLRGKMGKSQIRTTGSQTEAAKGGYAKRTEQLYEGI